MSTDHSHSAPKANRPRRIGIIFLISILLLLVFVGLLYAYISSSLFFRQWIEPQIADAIGYPIKIESVDYSPLGYVHLKNMQMTELPGESDSRLHLGDFELKFRILPLVHKRIEVQRLHADSVSAWITKDSNGNMIGPVVGRKEDKEEEEKKKKEKKGEGANWKLDLSDLDLRHIALKYVDSSKNERHPDQIDLTDLRLASPRLAPGEKMSAQGNGRLHMVQVGEKQTDFSGRIAINVNQVTRDANTDEVTGQAEFTDLRGRYNGQNLQGFRAVVIPAAQITNNQLIKTSPLSIRIESQGKPWAQADVFANWDLNKQSGDIRAQLQPVDRRLLNLLAPPEKRMDFRQTQVFGTFSAVFGQDSVLQELKGNAAIRNLNPTGKDLPASGFPTTNADINFDTAFPENENVILLKALTAKVMQGGQGEILSAILQKQLAINKDTKMPAPGKIGANALRLNIRNLDLAQWQALLPPSETRFRSGRLTANLSVGENPQSPGSIAIAGTVATNNLQGQSSNRAFGPLSSQSDLSAVMDTNQRLDIQRFVTALTSRGQSMGTLSATGAINQKPSLTGKVNATMQNIRLDAWPLPPAVTSKYAVQGGILSGKASIDLGKSEIALNPDMSIRGLTLTPKKAGAQPLANASADLNGQIRITKNDQGILQAVDIRSLKLNAGNPQPFLTLSANGNLDLQQGRGEIKADISQADIPRLLAFQGVSPESAQVEQGNLRANLVITMRDKNNLAIAGQGEVRPFALLVRRGTETKRLSLPLRMEFDQAMNTETSQLDVRKLHVEIENQGGQPGTLDISGKLNTSPVLDGNLSTKARNFQMLPLLPLLPQGVHEQADLRLARLDSADEQIVLTGNNSGGSAKGNATLSNVHPPVQKRKADIALTAQINNDIRFTPAAFLFDQFQIALSAPNQQPSRIDVKGSVPRGESSEPGKLAVSSNGVELQPLLIFAGQAPVPNAPPLTATNLKMDVTMSNEGTTIQALSTQLAGGNITCDSVSIGKSQGDAPAPIRWNQLKASGIDVPTIVANFAPKQNGRVTGKAAFESTGSARGFTQDAMAQFLRSTANANITDGQLKSIPLLQQLAAVTTLPELQDISFFKLESKFQTTEDGVQVQDIYLTGKTQKLRLRGRILYDQEMKINLELGLAGSLAQRVQRLRFAQFLQPDKDGYVVFPTPFAVSGKLGAPRIKFTLPTESLMNVGTGILQQELQKRMGGAPQPGAQPAPGQTPGPGQSPAPGETAAPAPTPGSLLDLGTGLLQQELQKKQNKKSRKNQPREEQTTPLEATPALEQAEPTPPEGEPPRGTTTPAPPEEPTTTTAPQAPPEATPAPKPTATPPSSLLDIGSGILQQQLEGRRKK